MRKVTIKERTNEKKQFIMNKSVILTQKISILSYLSLHTIQLNTQNNNLKFKK
jgi:hypothetical protein